jgi:lysozyme family protein
MPTRYAELPDVYLKNTLNYEGGYVNHPNDKGGETNRGITRDTLNGAIRAGLVPASVTIRSLTTDLVSVQKIYNQNYYKKGKANLLYHPLAFAHFDACVHLGVGGGTKLLQKTLNQYGAKLNVDGGFGDLTAKASASIQDTVLMVDLVNKYMMERENRFRGIVTNDPSQKVFLNGWLKRVGWVREWCLTHLT